MSNVIPFNTTTLPAIPEDLQDTFGGNSLTDLAKGSTFSSRRISIRGNRFRMQINGEEVATQDEAIEVVILQSSNGFLRQYYARPYDPKDTSPPDCWSNDGKTPHENSGSPQATGCSACPHNIAGSGMGTSKACQTKANIAIMMANNLEDGDIFEMTIPAQSLFGKYDEDKQRGGLMGYANFLAKRKLDPRLVVTKIEFDKNSATPLLWFSGVGYIPSESVRAVAEKSKSEEAQRAVQFNYPKPKDTGPEAAPAKAPTPTRAPARPPAETMAKASTILAEWGDEA